MDKINNITYVDIYKYIFYFYFTNTNSIFDKLLNIKQMTWLVGSISIRASLREASYF